MHSNLEVRGLQHKNMNNQDIKKNIKKVVESKKFKIALSVFGGLIIAMLIFQAGIFVGFHRAIFGRDWDKNYSSNFGGMRPGPSMIGGMYDRLPNAHGAIGRIIKADLPTIIVLDKDETEKVVLVNDDTIIRSLDGSNNTASLKIDSYVVVIGSPNESGQIEAKFIRITPSPITTNSSSQNTPQ